MLTETGRQLRAQQIDKRVREIESTSKQTFVELGELMLEVELQEYWKDLGHESYTAWIESAAPLARTSGFEARRLLKELTNTPDIAVEEFRDVPRSNLHLLVKVPASKRKKLLKQAKTLPEKKFREAINVQVPDLHLEE